MKKKVIIYSIVVLLFLIMIFIFSASNATNSNNLSKGILNRIICFYEKITHKDVYNELVIIKLNYPFRKLAHLLSILY